MRWDFAGGQDVSRLRLDLDFQRGFGTDATDEDSRVHIGISRAGAATNNSDFRPFELRILNNGTISINHLDGTEHEIPYSTDSLNHLTVFANSHDSLSAAYSDPELGDDVLAPNTFHVYLNGALVGKYNFHITPDPVNAPEIVFNENDNDLGRVGFYQDTSRQGGVIFDNIVLQDFGGPYFEADFEGDAVGEQPVGPFTFSPGSNTATNGAIVVGPASDPAAIAGQRSLLIYDESGGDPTHMRWDFAGGQNKSRLRFDVDFKRAFATDATDEDTRVHIGVARAGDATNNSDFRPFEIRILNNGTISINHLNGTEHEIEYNADAVNSLTVFANSHDTLSADFSDPDIGSGVVAPNTFHVFLNGVSVGAYDFHITPDPVNAPQIVFNESDEDLGRFAFYQDTSRQGAIIFDNIVLQDFGAQAGEPPAAPTALTVTEATAQYVRLTWTDNSDDELGFIIRRSTGGAFVQVGSVSADVTEFTDNDVDGGSTYVYRVYATNGVVSDYAELEVTTPAQLVPLITQFSADTQVAQGQEVELSVTALGEEPLTYQWYIGESGDTSNPVSGANAATYNTGPLDSTSSFWVRVSNTHGSDDSPTVTIDVHVPQVYNVSSVDELNDLIDLNLQPGDTVVVAPGYYENAHITIKAYGAEGAPITLAAEASGKSILTGDSFIEIGGEHIVVSGFVLTDGWNQSRNQALSFRAEAGTDLIANNSRFTECAIINYSPENTTGVDRDWVAMYGDNNRVDHCYFGGHTTAGVTLVVWLDGTENNHRIDNNHFHKRASGGGENGWETIRIGTSAYSLSSSRTIVEYNLFEECNGETEIISNKSGDNVFRYNTFLRSQGTLTLRHGDRAWVEGNYFIGGSGVPSTGGIRVIGEDHVIINNYIQNTAGRGGAAIAVYAGVQNSALSEYYAAHNALIANNTIVNVSGPAFTVGEGYGSSNRTVLPTGVTIANNLVYSQSSTGTFVGGEARDTATYEGNIAFGGASVGVSTGFTVTDPMIAMTSEGIWRPQAGSPVIDASVGSYPQVTLDLDGQDRTDAADVGADEVLQDAPGANLGGPLGPSDTGPFYLPANRILPELAPANFFGSGSPQGLNLYQAGNLGYVWATYFPYLWHEQLGWSYAEGGNGAYFLYLYDSQQINGWIYTSNDVYPYLYDYEGERWQYVMESEVGHVWVWDFTVNDWLPF